MFSLEFKTDNAAFEDHREVARLLRLVAQDVLNNQIHGKIHDYNGNTVGEWWLQAEDDYDEGC